SSESSSSTWQNDKNKSRNNLVYDLYDKMYLLDEDTAKRVDYTKKLLDKLYEKGVTESRPEGYIRFKTYHKLEREVEYLKNEGFSDDEIQTIMPAFTQARNVKKSGLKALRNNSGPYGEDYVRRMKEKGILYNNTKHGDYIWWHELYANTRDLYNALKGAEFNDDEINEIIEVYKKENASGYDLTGLKFANEDLAVYSMDEKLNNWTQGKTNWLTNSTAISSIDNKTPFVGVSLVQDDRDETVPISDLREGECLHFHPYEENGKRQTEVYVISSGTAALNVVKNGKVQVLYLNEGDLAVVGAGVMHEINSVKGEYEHIAAQVPSAFQYGFEFKSTDGAPKDYDKKLLEQEAISKLSEK
ncbi:MAG: cupin domain-containing protein, partial [Candidatus Gastranaerophilales bacterium]|nr:cupin domain-containing protein [Candidatus Gastranaerophilales bacterium]